MKYIHIFLVLLLPSCNPPPEFYGTFKERSMAFPAAHLTGYKKALRAKGWKITISGITTTSSQRTPTSFITSHYGPSRYTLIYNYKEPWTNLTIVDNKTGEEVCSYEYGEGWAFRPLNPAKFANVIEQHTETN